LEHGLITRATAPVCPVDDTGRFTAPVHDFVGQKVKDADKEIMRALKV
jgi:isoleucyl-tRNA synthetase